MRRNWNMNLFSKIEKNAIQKEMKTEINSEKNKIFDIVIPVGPNDLQIIKKQIEFTRKNIIGYRKIYIITPQSDLKLDGCIMIPENIFPFSLETVGEYNIKNDRRGWYLQQLIKLYAGFIIPEILDKYLVLDADTFFLKPTTFYKDGKCLYNYGVELHTPYFLHMQKLHPDLKRRELYKSGICHHMMLETKYIRELFNIIESLHNETFYNIFLKNVDIHETSGASEYEIYFNYMYYKHPTEIILRKLTWANVTKLFFSYKYDYVSYHWYHR